MNAEPSIKYSSPVRVVEQYGLDPDFLIDKVVVDVGANAGFFSLAASNMSAKSVTAYEMNEDLFEMLEERIEDSNITLIKKAVGRPDQDGDTIKYTRFLLTTGKARKQHTGLTSTVDHELVRFGKSDRAKFDTEQATAEVIGADKVLVEGIQVLKIDIEGAEWDLLRETPIPASVETLLLEIHMTNLYKSDWNALYAYLIEEGFTGEYRDFFGRLRGRFEDRQSKMHTVNLVLKREV